MQGIFWEPPWYLEGVLLWGEANEKGEWDEAVYTFVRALGAQFAAKHVQDAYEEQ